MLTQLSISGLATLESLHLSFSDGFNVVTGETGAGKSLIIKSINLALGGKLSPEDVHAEWSQATVTVVFELQDSHPALVTLKEMGIPSPSLDDDYFSLMIRRQVSTKGRSQGWINDVPVTIGTIRALGSQLIDICAQHENQKLLSPRGHHEVLDSFIDDNQLVPKVRALRTHCEQGFKELSGILEKHTAFAREIDFTEFRLRELQDINPSCEDYEALKEYIESHNSRRHGKQSLQSALSAFEELGGSTQSPTDSLRRFRKAISNLELKEKADLLAQIDLISQTFDDISFTLERLLESYDSEDELYASQLARFESYKELMYKLRVHNCEDLIAYSKQLEDKSAFLRDFPEIIKSAISELCIKVESLTKTSKKLTKSRVKAANTVETTLEKEFRELGMAGAALKVRFETSDDFDDKFATSEYLESLVEQPLIDELNLVYQNFAKTSRNGYENARFDFISSSDAEPRPLENIASGGEISRIVLALKHALRVGAQTCVLVFDEIDTGISGKVADLVGRKLNELGKKFQIICVSHLPQVASYAERHFTVERVKKNAKTTTEIRTVTGDERTKEIARLLSGTTITKHSIANAKTLLSLASTEML